MRPRSIAVSAATLIAAASMTPLTAQAAGQNTLYVNNGKSTCTDSGSGTYDAPFCTIQAAADIANPGDVVNVAPGAYAATTIARSGTASAPIVFTGNLGSSSSGVAATITGLNVSGASYVEVEDLRVADTSSGGLVVDGGSHVLVRHDDILAPTFAVPEEVHITGGASAVTVEDSVLNGEALVDGGSTGTVITTNALDSADGSLVSLSVSEAANTAVTGNTFSGCGASVSVADSSSSTSIENNVVNDAPVSPGSTTCEPYYSQAYAIAVDSSSASGTTEDYNDVDAQSGVWYYEWAGKPYPSASALYDAVGQGQHDYDSDTPVTASEGSPLINSANSAAVGELPLDIDGDPRTDDPLVAPTGAGPYDYYDRGAVQFQDPVTPTISSSTSSATQVPVGGTFTLHAQMADTWSDAFTYQFRIDGGATLTSGSDGTVSTSLSAPGTYQVSMYAVPANGSAPRNFSVLRITAVAATPLAPVISASVTGPTSVNVSDVGTTGSWNITGVTFDFGDGTPKVEVGDGTVYQHTYAAAGTYKITETVTDADGETATTSSSVTTNAPAAGTLTAFTEPSAGSLVANFDNPPNAADIAHASVAAMPDGTVQVAAVTKTGVVQFAVRETNGSWQSWQTLSQPGVTVKSVGIAALPNGSSQLIEVTTRGVLEHTVRNADGTWQTGWGVPGGSTGFTEASITALPDGNTQLVAVTTGGQVKHDIRFANGSWQGWNVLSQPGVTLKDASIAGMPDGSAQILEVTTGGQLRHDIRFANGSWQSGWGVPAQTSPFTQASITALPSGSSEIVGVTEGGLEFTVRYAGGSWASNWNGFGTDQLDTVSEDGASAASGGTVQIVAVSAG